jgi:hypothetical protein
VVLFATTGRSADDWDEKWKVAGKNRDTAHGGDYEKAFGKTFFAAYAPWLNECAQKRGASMGGDFDLLLKMGSKGDVRDARIKPETKMAQCFRDLARQKTLPAPPQAGYWWLTAIQFNANP